MSVYTNAQEFWSNFLKEEDTMKNCILTKDYETLNPIIEKLDDVMYQMIGAHFFIETAYEELEVTFDTGPNKTIQYLAQYFKDMAPESIKKNWIINASLPPMSEKAIQAELKIKDNSYYLNDFFVFYEVNDENQTISCNLYCPGYHLIDNEETKREMCLYLTEMAVGQTTYEAYLMNIDYLDEPKQDQKFCNLIEFYETIMEIVDKKGWKTYDKPIDIYSIYQPIQDFASDSLRNDMKFIFTTHPLLIEETIEKKNDVLADLKAKSGEYGYIYYNNPFHTKEDALLRQKLSKKINEELIQYKVGRVVGGAIGKSYSYIDCIVYDKKRFENLLNEIRSQIKEVDLYYTSF